MRVYVVNRWFDWEGEQTLAVHGTFEDAVDHVRDLENENPSNRSFGYVIHFFDIGSRNNKPHHTHEGE